MVKLGILSQHYHDITIIIILIITTCNSGVDSCDEGANNDPQSKHQVQVSERNQVGNNLTEIIARHNDDKDKDEKL